MNLKTLIRTTAILLLVALATGCASRRKAVVKFHDASSVNAVLQFQTWDCTFLVRPRYDEDGFLRMVPRDGVREVMDEMNVRRGTVVVVIGWTYDGAVLDRVVTDWKTILNQCGFQRVVFLRSNADHRLNGSIVIDDSKLSLSSFRAESRF